MNSDSSSSSVTEWLESVKNGSDSAARKIWERYVEQLVREANRRLKNLPHRHADGEDIAQEAFAGFFQGIRAGRFPKLNDRHDLWQLLIVLAGRRASDHRRHELADCRGAGNVHGDSGVHRLGESGKAGMDPLDTLEALPVTPESADQLLRLFQDGFPALADYGLQRIALDRFANHSEAEIAQRHGISVRAVQRKLTLIRAILKRTAAGADEGDSTPNPS